MPISDLLNTRSYAVFKRVELIARSVVEGSITGLHRSPFKGFAVEFEQHRQYVPGDDLKHLDWKLLAKLDKCYIKQYEEDTSLRAWIVLDTSGSMAYGSGKQRKIDTARHLVGVMTYLLLQQQDSVGLVTCNDKIQHFRSPRSTTTHMNSILETIAKIEPGEGTGLGEVLHTLAGKTRRRALIIIISDFFTDPDSLSLAFNHFAHKKHELMLYQVLDPAEIDFKFRDLTRFESLEGADFHMVDPIRLREAYLAKFNEHQNRLRRTCHNLKVDFETIKTSDPFERTVAERLARRMRR